MLHPNASGEAGGGRGLGQWEGGDDQNEDSLHLPRRLRTMARHSHHLAARCGLTRGGKADVRRLKGEMQRNETGVRTREAAMAAFATSWRRE